MHKNNICFKYAEKVYSFKPMGNFYIVEAGGNGFAARKQKKNSSQGSKADKAFLPEGFSPRAKMFYLLLTRGMNFFFCLRVAKPFPPNSTL